MRASLRFPVAVRRSLRCWTEIRDMVESLGMVEVVLMCMEETHVKAGRGMNHGVAHVESGSKSALGVGR